MGLLMAYVKTANISVEHLALSNPKILGGLLLGVIEALGAAYISIAWKDAIAFCVLILILIGLSVI